MGAVSTMTPYLHRPLPTLALAADGTPFIAFDGGDVTRLAFRAPGSDAGSVWTSVNVGDPKTLMGYDASVAVTSTGQPRVVYYRSGGLYYYQWSGNLTDQPQEEKILDTGAIGIWRLLLDSHDQPHVVLTKTGTTSRRNDLFIFRRADAGWTQQNAQDGMLDTGLDGRMDFALDQAENEAILIESSVGMMLVHGSVAGTSYEPAPTDPEGSGFRPGLQVDPFGGIHAVFLRSVSGLYLLERSPGAPWVNRLADDSMRWLPSEPRLLTLARDTKGRLHVAYIVATTPTANDLVYGYFDGCNWTFQTVAHSASTPFIAVDATGGPHIAYEDHSTGSVAYVRAEAIGP